MVPDNRDAANNNTPSRKGSGGKTRKSAPKGRKSMRAERLDLRGLVKPTSQTPGAPRTPKEVFSTSAHDEMMDRLEKRVDDVQRQSTPEDDGKLSFHGVPLNEELDLSPEMIEEYCEREPFLLTSNLSMAGSAKFGIIPARYKAMAETYKEEMKLIDLARSKPEDRKGTSQERFLVSVDKVQKLAGMFQRVSEGDTMTSEYSLAEQEYSKYMEAYEIAADIYHKQMQRVLCQLGEKMSRRQIGSYAQNMWLNNFKRYENESHSPSLFTHDLSGETIQLQKCAQKTALSALKWTALVINEMPMNQGMDKPGSYDIVPRR